MRTTALLLCLLLGAAACGGAADPLVPASPSPAAAPPTPDAVADDAVGWVPPDARSATVVRWDRIVPDGTAADEVLPTVVASQDVQPPSELGASALLLPEVVGIGLEDLAWELSLTLDGPPAVVFALRDGVDPTAVVDALTGAGFSTDDRDGVRVLSSEVDLSMDWPRVGLFLSTTAVRDDGVVVAGGDAATVDALLAHAADAPLAPLAASVAALGDPAGWMALIGDACPPLNPTTVLGDSPDEAASELADQLEDIAGLGTYRVLAVGTGSDADVPVRAAFTYADPASAEADAAAREAVWATADSRPTGQPLSEHFTVAGVTTEGATTTLSLEGQRPSTIYALLLRRDDAWAACG